MSYSLNKTKYLSDAEQTKLGQVLDLAYLRADNMRDCILFWLLLNTGGRATEVLNVDVSDIDHEAKTIYIRGIKGSRDREIPLTDEMYNRVREYSAPLTGRLFPITYWRLRQIWEVYRPVPKKIHCLRHTFAINLYKRSRDLRLVQVALGHKNIQNTMVYAEYLYSKEELRRLIA